MGLLRGRRAVVTGGGAGLGRATCIRLAAEGATVGVLDRRAEDAGEVAEAISGEAFAVDVTDAPAVESAIAAAAAAMDGIDLLVNNAGVGWMHPFVDTRPEKWSRVLDVNLTGTYNCVRSAVPFLRQRSGTVVNVASISGVRPSAGEAPYAASKAGVLAITASLALELGPEIRVNAVSPGPVDTALLRPLFERHPSEQQRYVAATPLGRIAEPVDIADVIVFLSSELARFLTGQNLVVDGGLTLHGSSVDGMLELILSDRGGLDLRADYRPERRSAASG